MSLNAKHILKNICSTQVLGHLRTLCMIPNHFRKKIPKNSVLTSCVLRNPVSLSNACETEERKKAIYLHFFFVLHMLEQDARLFNLPLVLIDDTKVKNVKVYIIANLIVKK